MPSTFTNLRYHVVFATKERWPMIDLEWRPRLHEWMGGAARTIGGIALAIGGVADHVHLLLGLRTTHAIADVLRDIKSASSAWVHDEIGYRKFAWQEGYGAFTVSASSVDSVRRYIERQEEHHRKRSFQDEYRDLLKRHGVEFDERFLW
jgi:REP element-mobilizing transposase RayT